jgi:glycosyltransferase involved in cell wall biosynthesis
MQIFFQGNIHQPSSFSIINGHLISGLRKKGYSLNVFPTDALANVAPADRVLDETPDARLPDIYLFHGHPYDVRSAPGRTNIFILNYEYSALKETDAHLIPRLNAVFDLALVPTRFIKKLLIAEGLKIPIEIVPWAVDPDEFHPSIEPEKLPTDKGFVFLYVGAVNERKGTDRLLEAYFEEFTSEDDVVLVIKEAFRHPAYADWASELENRYRRRSKNAPELLWIHEHAPSVAGYFTAADVGVFPHRGEGFGLPILECIASGRRVIVTDGTGPADFCSSRNSWLFRTGSTPGTEQNQLNPDYQHLQLLMRKAFEQGKQKVAEISSISRTVKDWTWQRTITSVDDAIRKHLHQSQDSPKRRKAQASSLQTPAVAYAFYETGPTSWKKFCAETDRALRNRFVNYRPLPYSERFNLKEVDILVGLSEHCLERIIKANNVNPRVLKIVHQEGTVLGDRVALLNRERRFCGLEPVLMTPIDFWRNKTENALADFLVVSSSVARGFFLQNGFLASRMKVIPYGIKTGQFQWRENAGKIRFLFVGTDPLRKGIRHLFEAWNRAKLKNAELVCITNLEILKSQLLLKYLVSNPNILVKPPVSHRAFARQYTEIDCQVLPSLEDTFSVSVGDGMGYGKPAIVSTSTGIQDLITHKADGYIVKAGDVAELTEALQFFAENRRRLRQMGEAAYDTARQYPWSRFRHDMGELIHSLYREHRQ